MISALNLNTKNYCYSPKVQSAVNVSSIGSISDIRVQKISYNPSFKGSSSVRSFAIRLLERAKSKISHSAVFIVGPPGVGKDSIISVLRKTDKNFRVATNYTTRPPRSGDIPGENYYFISRKDYDSMDNQGQFVQKAQVGEYFYGLTYDEVNSKRKGQTLIVNLSGKTIPTARNIYGKSAVLIFIKPPSKEELVKRLTGRGTETSGAIKTRLDYGDELSKDIGSFDKIVVNDNLEQAAKETYDYIQSRRRLTVKMVDVFLKLLKNND